MDLIRIFIDTAFSKIAERYFAALCETNPDISDEKQDGLIIDEVMFVDECRCHHPELSDDQIRMIFGLFRDEWTHPPEDSSESDAKQRQNIFNVLFRFSQDVLRMKDGEPLVVFRHLFRWRELTLLVGEDTMVTAFMAYNNQALPRHPKLKNPEIRNRLHFDGIDFCKWPTILHNDNPHLNHIFRTNRMCDLHSHLYASTDNFTISWVSLMNHIKNRTNNFIKLGEAHDGSRAVYIARTMYSYVALACSIRLYLWRLADGRSSEFPASIISIQANTESYAKKIQKVIDEEKAASDPLDYIPSDIESPMRVIAGERKFLYTAFKFILQHDDIVASRLLYQYILAKNRFRGFLIQVDSNRGFANFKRHQDMKTIFMRPDYRSLVAALAVWEALNFNHTDLFETRISPFDEIKRISGFRKECKRIEEKLSKDTDTEWSLLIHFIKHPENFKESDASGPGDYVRDEDLRKKIHRQSIVLRQVLKMSEWESAENAYLSRIRGIDAASSEIGCRPEIFAQTFRFLKSAGFAATFHVGEDFYDIADGLRAIEEAILFLRLEAGDRLGHALALGIDPDEFYGERHNYIALPMQWMLDNVVWLYFSSRKHNTQMEPSTEDFLLRTFRELVRRIGYEHQVSKPGEAYRKVEIIDYYQSMLLRGDTPSILDDKHDERLWMMTDSWERHEKLQSEELREIRKWNDNAKMLLSEYMTNKKIISKGRMIKSFEVPSGYRKLIRMMQDRMMKKVSQMQLGIECCPSSNYKIGYCKRFDRHPIFRFMPVRAEHTQYPLAVTVNTDDLGVFSTSLPNEYSLLALALMKTMDSEGKHLYSSQEIYDWVERVIKNSQKFAFNVTSHSPLKDL